MALEISLPCSRVSDLRLSHECLCKHAHVVLETLLLFSSISL